MNEEKIVKINGIEISKSTGFKNLQFETSRYSDGLNTIRGFGSMLNESNLNVVDTVSIDFVLNYYELEELAHVYNLFKANGILPIENEYLLKKIKSTYTKGKFDQDKDYGKNDYYLKSNISHFICFLQRLSITSLEKTVNSYKVNMILTLYENALTEDEYEEYMKCYEDWNKKTNFNNICLTAIRKEIQNLADTKRSLNIKAYNTEILNALYKEHMVDSATFNKKLKPNKTEEENEAIAEKKLENIKVKLGINEDEIDISSAATTITIPYHSIMQVELITSNIISNIPMIGKPVGHKSYLGIGDSHFSVKLIFNEYENNNSIKEIEEKNSFGKTTIKKVEEVSVVEQLKRISDKNIINHKIELEHPLVQMFDFYTSNILNITFNNLEEANGIMVNIIFSLNGFRYSEETTINLDNLMYDMKYDNDYKQEQIGALYLEYVADYLFNNRKTPISGVGKLMEFGNNVLESMVVDNQGTASTYDSPLFTHDYHMLDFLASYSSFPTSFGAHKYSDNELWSPNSLFHQMPEKEYLNEFFNKNTEYVVHEDTRLKSSDIFLLNDNLSKLFSISIEDKDLQSYRALFNGKNYYSYIDNLSAITVLGNIKYQNKVVDYLYSENFVSYGYRYIINEIIKPITIELFNTKQNGDTSIYTNSIFKKIYDEFYYRLFYNLNFSCNELIGEIKNLSYISSNNQIIFCNVYKSIATLSDQLFDLFIKTLYDGNFIERITYEVINEELSGTLELSAEENIHNNINEVKDNVKRFLLEFESVYDTNKEIIKERAYNIFLTKLNYFLFNYCITVSEKQKGTKTSNGIKYEEKFLFDFDNIIRIYLISSAVHSLLLLRTQTRTDHFDNHIVLGMKNIGYKISTYNSRLEQGTYYDYKNDKEYKLNVFFYQLFRKNIFLPNENENQNFYYKDKIKYNDFFYEYKNVFDTNPNKDINFFYGQQIPQCMLYKYLYDASKHKEPIEEIKNVIDFLNSEKYVFVNDKYDEKTPDVDKYNYNSLDINQIKFPYLNFGFVASHFTELFYDKECKFMNSKTKKRVIGNIDPFENMKRLSDIVYDDKNYVMPDYDICIFKKKYSDNVGDRYKKAESSRYIFLKNAASLSLVANPKTKIKTLNIVLNNTSKSIFNFNPMDGSFDMVSLNQGKIDIINIEAGDEVRVRIGYDEKIQIFNGFINSVNNTGNQLILNCSSFASLLYNEKINELNLQPSSGNDISFITPANQMKTTLEKVDSYIYDQVRALHNITNPINDHIFISNDGKTFINKVFSPFECASMYSAFNLAIANLKTFCSDKFVRSKVSDITNTGLAAETFIKKTVNTITGSSKLAYQNFSKTYDIYTNINNVDIDYETYGMRKIEKGSGSIISFLFPSKFFNSKSSDTFSVYSLNNYQYPDNKNKKIEISVQDNNNIFNNDVNNIEVPHISSKVTEGDYGRITLPVQPTTNIITSLYNELRTNGRHMGIDICSPIPSSIESKIIYSIADGTVITSMNSRTAGNFIEIMHTYKDKNGNEKKFISEYMHLEKRYVKIGEKVKLGTEIGLMGTTGRSSGIHLHFGIYSTDNHLSYKSYLNPFDAKLLPRHNWNVDWNQVNVYADNGQYTEEWLDSYRKSKKSIQHFGNSGGF